MTVSKMNGGKREKRHKKQEVFLNFDNARNRPFDGPPVHNFNNHRQGHKNKEDAADLKQDPADRPEKSFKGIRR